MSNFNTLPENEAINLLMQCNTSEKWCKKLTNQRPYADFEALVQKADAIWSQSSESDLLEAFEGHPEIGNISTLREKYKNTAVSAGHEQSAVNTANDAVLQALSRDNKAYKDKFGFIFIVCATGKSAEEMLHLLQERLANSRQQELQNAAEEQAKITRIRLEKLIKPYF